MSFLLQLDCVPNIYICAAPSAHNPQTLFKKQIKYLKPVKNCDANTQVIKKFDSNSKVIRKSQQSPMCGSYLLLLAAMKGILLRKLTCKSAKTCFKKDTRLETCSRRSPICVGRTCTSDFDFLASVLFFSNSDFWEKQIN